MKEYELKSTLEEKAEQLEKWAAMKEEVDSKQAELDSFVEMAQSLASLTQDTHVNPCATQLISRYQALQHSLKVGARCIQLLDFTVEAITVGL